MSSSTFFSSAGDHLSISGFLDNILVDFPSQNHDFNFSSSGNSDRKTNSSSSGSHDSETTNKWGDVNINEERRRKRLISNRESAKRSRARKRKQLEKLSKEVVEYKTGNQELLNRLRFVNLNGRIVCQENERLRLESEMQQQKLYNLQQQLLLQELNNPLLLSSAWPCNNNNNNVNDQNQITFNSDI